MSHPSVGSHDAPPSRHTPKPDGSAPSDTGPDQPAVAAFMADLRTLRAESGAPSYATLGRRTGLPRSTVYDALRRDRLPALATTLALVTALGGDPAEWRRRWAELRAELDRAPQPVHDGPTAADGRPESSDRTTSASAAAAAAASTSTSTTRRRRGWLIAAAVVVLLVGSGVTYLAWPSGSSCRHVQIYTVTSTGDLLNASGQTVGRTQPGDTIEVRSHKHDAFAHRLLGTVERTGDVGYVDEARIDPARTVCE